MTVAFSSRISGTGSCLPAKELSNLELEKRVDTSNEWILERTGISVRHIADENECTSDFALTAAHRALEAAGLAPQQLDAILVATVTPDQSLPSTACVLQSKLKCGSVMALDVSAACSGFLYALSVADQFIKSGMYKNILVIGAETLSRIVDYNDRQTCILFGDGAGAVVLSRAESGQESMIHSSHLHANGELGDLLMVPGGGSKIPLSARVLDERLCYIQMKGREVFKSAVRALSERCTEALAANKMSIDDVQWFLVHQANLRIIEAVGQHLNVPAERVPINVGYTGNTSSASIPILLDESVRAGKIRRGENIMMAAFGAGLTSASVLLRY